MKLRLIVLGVVLVAAACGSDGGDATATTAGLDSAATTQATNETTPAPPEEVTIGALWLDASSFYSAVQRGIENGAAEVEVTLLGRNSESDESIEAEQLETLIGARVDAIIISAVNDISSEALIAKAAEAGIPVICYNTCIANYEDHVYSYVTGSHFQQGGAVGKATGEYLVAEGITAPQIGVVSCEQYGACQDRISGFKEELAKLVPDAVFVASEEALEVDSSAQAVTDMLTANPDIDVIYGEAGNMVSGAAVAIRESGSDTVVFGHDITVDTARLLLEGDIVKYINAIIGEDMGQTTIDLALKAINGEASPGVLFNQDPVDFFSSAPDAVQQWLDTHPEG